MAYSFGLLGFIGAPTLSFPEARRSLRFEALVWKPAMEVPVNWGGVLFFGDPCKKDPVLLGSCKAPRILGSSKIWYDGFWDLDSHNTLGIQIHARPHLRSTLGLKTISTMSIDA